MHQQKLPGKEAAKVHLHKGHHLEFHFTLPLVGHHDFMLIHAVRANA